jgi:hypothetical protein
MASAEAQPYNDDNVDSIPPLLRVDDDDDKDWFNRSTSISYPTDPTTYQEAMASPHAAKWTRTLQKEFTSLKDLRVYCLVPCSSVPPGLHIMCGHPIFKIKHDEHENPSHFKMRYMCHRYSAVYRQDYTKPLLPLHAWSPSGFLLISALRLTGRSNNWISRPLSSTVSLNKRKSATWSSPRGSSNQVTKPMSGSFNVDYME